ncbi:MAG: capsid protein [Sphingomonadales bacterium]|nr:capsid protein [Sphingomonadales bacterium]
MSLSAYPIDPHLTAIAIAYKNEDYIADDVAPRVRVGKQKFTFLQYASDQFFNIPDTRVGRRSKPNEVNLEASEVTDSTEDFALDGGVPKADMDNADERYDPLGDEVEFLQELIALDRESRVAGYVFNNATYNPGLRETLAGTSQFSDYVNSSPIKKIRTALDMPLVRPNQMTFGQEGWTSFSSHPEIVEAVLGTAAKKGIVSREAVANLFEVKEVLVGAARANSVKRGQAPALTRLWGKHLALTHKAKVPQAKGALQFLASFEFGDRIGAQWEDKNMGMRGGTACRTGESLRERIVAADAGYFFQNAFG